MVTQDEDNILIDEGWLKLISVSSVQEKNTQMRSFCNATKAANCGYEKLLIIELKKDDRSMKQYTTCGFFDKVFIEVVSSESLVQYYKQYIKQQDIGVEQILKQAQLDLKNSLLAIWHQRITQNLDQSKWTLLYKKATQALQQCYSCRSLLAQLPEENKNYIDSFFNHFFFDRVEGKYYCELTIRKVDNDFSKRSTINHFKKDFPANKEKCAVLVIKNNETEQWFYAGYDQQGLFKEIELKAKCKIAFKMVKNIADRKQQVEVFKKNLKNDESRVLVTSLVRNNKTVWMFFGQDKQKQCFKEQYAKARLRKLLNEPKESRDNDAILDMIAANLGHTDADLKNILNEDDNDQQHNEIIKLTTANLGYKHQIVYDFKREQSLCPLFYNYLLDIINAPFRKKEINGADDDNDEWNNIPIGDQFSSFNLEDLKISNKAVARSAQGFLEKEQKNNAWVIDYLYYYSCQSRNKTLRDIAMQLNIKSFHYKAKKLGIIQHQKDCIDYDHYRETILGEWLNSLSIDIEPDNYSAIEEAFEILCFQALTYCKPTPIN